MDITSNLYVSREFFFLQMRGMEMMYINKRLICIAMRWQYRENNQDNSSRGRVFTRKNYKKAAL